MLFIKSLIYKLLIITLAFCYLCTSVYAGKLPTSQSIVNKKEEVATSAKAAVSAKESAAATVTINKTENKSSEEEYGDEEDEDDTAHDENETAEKNAVQPAADTSLSVWGIVRGLWNWIKDDISESLFGGDDGKPTAVGEGRTFGKIRRLQMALIPIVFKFGVLSAMVAFLVALGLKTLFLVKVLVVMNLLALFAKLFSLKTNFGHVEHVPVPAHPPVWNWTPNVNHGWQSDPVDHHINKEIHLHIYGGQVQPQATGYSYGNAGAVAGGLSHGWERRDDPYRSYGTMTLQEQQNDYLLPNEFTTTFNAATGSTQQFSAKLPANHRKFKNGLEKKN